MKRTYSEAMRDSKAYISIKLELSEPVEIEDFARAFAGLGGVFDDFLAEHDKKLRGKAQLYVREVRKGSIIADLVPNISDLIGYVDNVLIVGGFASLFSKRVRAFMAGQFLESPKKSELNHVTDALTAIANDPNGTATVETIVYEENGENCQLAIKFNSQEARAAVKTIEHQKREMDEIQSADYQRVTMLFERPGKSIAGSGKKSGEVAIIEEIAPKPLPIIYASGMAEEAIKSHFAEDNVFKLGFLVDVNVDRRNGNAIAYKVTELHQVFDLPDAD